VRQCNIGDGGVEHLHKGADGDDDGDDPGVEYPCLWKALVVELRNDICGRLLNVCNFRLTDWLWHNDPSDYLRMTRESFTMTHGSFYCNVIVERVEDR
jgi:hypothetical protein